MFKNNICGDQSRISDGMPDSANSLILDFFISSRWPPASVAEVAKDVEVDLGKAAENLKGGVVPRSRAFPFFYFLCLL